MQRNPPRRANENRPTFLDPVHILMSGAGRESLCVWIIRVRAVNVFDGQQRAITRDFDTNTIYAGRC